MNQVSAVVFDLGGVLVDWDPRHLYRTLIEDEAAMERFLAEVCTPEWNAAQDAGRPWAEAVTELAARHPEHRELIAAYDERWTEMLGGEMPETVAVLADVRDAGHPVYALTNWSAEKFPHARERYPWLEWFAGVLVSGEERIAKPDPRIFALLCDRFGLDPGRTVYVDDSRPNVDAAARLGMIALHFTGAGRLRHDLEGAGVLPARPGDEGAGS